MIRLLIIVLCITIAAAGMVWLADRPGELVLTWQGYRIQTSVMVAGIGLLLLAGVVIALFVLLQAFAAAPGALSGFFRSRRRQRGYQALSRGMIAVGAGDARAASRFAGQAEGVLADEPLTLLLKAQAAQLRGDRDTARSVFESMMESSETETLGLRGLYVEAQRNGNMAAARGFASRALQINPATPWAADAIFDMMCAERDWPAALLRLAASARAGIVDRAEMRRKRAVLLTAQALEAEDHDNARALALASEAHGLAPELVPAAVLAGQLAAHEGSLRKAMRILERTWKHSPHPDIAEAYAHVRPGDSAIDRLKRLRKLAQSTPDEPEAAIAIAQAEADAREWDKARRALEPLLKDRPSARICALMAHIEEEQYGDKGKAREWLARAMQAPRDPAWTADGYVSSQWEPISPVTGRLDAFEWKVPVERVAGEEPEIGPALPPVAGPVEAAEPVEAAPEPARPAPAAAPVSKEPEQPAAASEADPEPEPEPEPGPEAGPGPRPAPRTDGAAGEAVPEDPKAQPRDALFDREPPAAPAGQDKAKREAAPKAERPETSAAAGAEADQPQEKLADPESDPAGIETSQRAPDDPGPEGSALLDDDARLQRGG